MTSYHLTLSGSGGKQIELLAEELNAKPQDVIRSILWHCVRTGHLPQHIKATVTDDINELQARREISRIKAEGIRIKRALTLITRVKGQIPRYRGAGLDAVEMARAMQSYKNEAKVTRDGEIITLINNVIDHQIALFALDDQYMAKCGSWAPPGLGYKVPDFREDRNARHMERYNDERDEINARFSEVRK